jgi:outer membrane lipoprotein-sorting protein
MKTLFLSLLLATAFASTPEQKGLEIARKSEKANNGFKGEKSTMEMILLNAAGEKIERKMDSKVRETTDDGDMSIITFKWPADVKGTKMLTWTHKKDDDDQWLYLPSIKRVKRISSRNKSGSFMGSEFSYEDLGSQEIEKYSYKHIKDEKLNGRDSWVLERVPNDKKSGYSKQVIWMDKEYLNATKTEYYDRKGDLLKTANFSNYKKFGEFWRAGKIEMTNHQTSKKSILTWSDRELGKKFSKRDFNKNSLKR